MKKALKMLLVSLAVAAVSSVALAEDAGVSIGAWGRGLFVPAMSNSKGDVVTMEGTSWSWGEDSGSSKTRVGFTVAGNSDYVGFQADIFVDGGEVTQGDQAYVYAKPMDMMTLKIGNSIYYDDLRGNATYGAWNWLRYAGMNDEDFIFARADLQDGALIALNPIAPLKIFAGFENLNGDKGTYDDATGEKYTTADMFMLGQYGVGYEIAGVGTVRAQYIGARSVDTPYSAPVAATDPDGTPDSGDETDAVAEVESEYTDYATINAAVKIDQLVQGLYIDLGVFYPTDDEMGDTQVNAYEKYQMGAMTFHLTEGIVLEKTNAVSGSDEMAMQFGFGLDYDLGNGLAINSDVRYYDECYSGNEDGQIGFMAGVAKGFSNGLVGVAFEGSTGNFAVGLNKEASDDFCWAVPVKVEYWF